MDDDLNDLSTDEIAARLGVEVLCEIGAGDDGKVFLLDDGRALKITSSRVEAGIAMAMLESGRTHRGFPAVHGLWWTEVVAVFPCGARRSYTTYVIVRDEVADVFDGSDPASEAAWDEAVHSLNEGWRDGRWDWIEAAVSSPGGKALIPVYSALLWARDALGVVVRDVGPGSLGRLPGGGIVIRDFSRGVVPDALLQRVEARDFARVPDEPASSPSMG
jgi:hypothetical protein